MSKCVCGRFSGVVLGIGLGLGSGAFLGFATAGSALAQMAGEAPADQLLAEGHYLRAEQPVRAALRRTPNDSHDLTNLSIIDWSFNRLDASIADAERAVAAAPGSAEAHSHLADALGAKLVSSNAGAMEKISLAHRFRKEIDRTLELDPNDVDSLQDLAQFYWHAPGMVGGDKSKARQTAERLFRISPFRGASAQADFASEDSDARRRSTAVVAIWQAAVAARPQDYDSLAALAAAHVQAYLQDTGDPNHLSAAEAEAKHARLLDPRRVEAYKVLAMVYARAGRWNDLDAVLQQSRNSVTDDRTPAFLAADVILARNAADQMQRAEQLLRDYLAQPAEGQEPTHAAAHWKLGQVLEKQGRRGEAVRELQTAVQQDGSLEGARKDLKRLS